ncbi:MAG: SDR family NAD(P)-dependent oxidoreductase [Actinomycetota bacterium]|nr:SDR family NAD(P)-dependent oxidoreductase [Actinomycetota bacterium]
MDVSNLTGKVACVTGAASGIGRATALELARRGCDLAICDLDEGGLAETAEGSSALGRRVHSARVDVADLEQMKRFADAALGALGRIDIVVNNAGIAVGGAFVDVPLHEFAKVMGVNLMGVVHGCHVFLPRMLEQETGGHIVNIASMAGYIAGPGSTSYTASKFAVIGFSESLRAELREHGIGVTAVCPGIIDTPIVRTSRAYGAAATPEYRERGARLFERRNYGPDRVARAILKAIARNRAVAPVTPEAWIGYWIKRLFPGLIALAGRASARSMRPS